MRILAILIFNLIVFSNAHADTWARDMKLGFNGRSHPVGGQFFGTIGYSAPLWGSTDQWKYGYVRAGINAATSVIVNRLGFELQVFPVSILGFGAGFESSLRSFRPGFIDCYTYECFGRLDRKFLKGTMMVGAAGIFFIGNARYEKISTPGTTHPFYDEMTLISGRNSGETVLTLNPTLLATINSDLKVGAASVYVHGETSGNYSHLYGPIAAFNPYSKNMNVILGAGLNESSLVQSGITIFTQMTYTFDASLSIADQSLRSETYSSLF